MASRMKTEVGLEVSDKITLSPWKPGSPETPGSPCSP